jgi:hypothetical protein
MGEPKRQLTIAEMFAASCEASQRADTPGGGEAPAGTRVGPQNGALVENPGSSTRLGSSAASDEPGERGGPRKRRRSDGNESGSGGRGDPSGEPDAVDDPRSLGSRTNPLPLAMPPSSAFRLEKGSSGGDQPLQKVQRVVYNQAVGGAPVVARADGGRPGGALSRSSEDQDLLDADGAAIDAPEAGSIGSSDGIEFAGFVDAGGAQRDLLRREEAVGEAPDVTDDIPHPQTAPVRSRGGFPRGSFMQTYEGPLVQMSTPPVTMVAHLDRLDAASASHVVSALTTELGVDKAELEVAEQPRSTDLDGKADDMNGVNTTDMGGKHGTDDVVEVDTSGEHGRDNAEFHDQDVLEVASAISTMTADEARSKDTIAKEQRGLDTYGDWVRFDVGRIVDPLTDVFLPAALPVEGSGMGSNFVAQDWGIGSVVKYGPTLGGCHLRQEFTSFVRRCQSWFLNYDVEIWIWFTLNHLLYLFMCGHADIAERMTKSFSSKHQTKLMDRARKTLPSPPATHHDFFGVSFGSVAELKLDLGNGSDAYFVFGVIKHVATLNHAFTVFSNLLEHLNRENLLLSSDFGYRPGQDGMSPFPNFEKLVQSTSNAMRANIRNNKPCCTTFEQSVIRLLQLFFHADSLRAMQLHGGEIQRQFADQRQFIKKVVLADPRYDGASLMSRTLIAMRLIEEPIKVGFRV